MTNNARRMIRIAVVVAGVLLVTAAMPSIVEPATGATPSPAAAAVGVRASLRSELNDYLNKYGSAEHISAVSLAVTTRGGRPDIDIAVGSNRYGTGRAVSPY